MFRERVSILDVFTYLSLLLPMIFLTLGNPELRVLVLGLCLAFSIIHLVRQQRYGIDFSNVPCLILLLLQWSIAFSIQVIDGSFVPQIYFFIILSHVAYLARPRYSIPFAISCYFGFVFGVYFHQRQPPFDEISFVVPRLLEYALIFGFSYVTQKTNIQKEQLRHAYDKLQLNQLQLEEKMMMEERIRLSREVHDTIGHTLTTALVGLETGKQLALHQQTELAVEKLDLARDQVKSSLENVRKSMKTLHKQQSFINFERSLQQLIKDTEVHTGVQVDVAISALSSIDAKQELAIYRALQEGLTNGIRHGKCTRFHFSLQIRNEYIYFTLEDNGTMPKHWSYGFGLTAMKERIEQLRGSMELSNNEQGGCRLFITMPSFEGMSKRQEGA